MTNLTPKENERLEELEEKNSRGPDPRLTKEEAEELQTLLDKEYNQNF